MDLLFYMEMFVLLDPALKGTSDRSGTSESGYQLYIL